MELNQTQKIAGTTQPAQMTNLSLMELIAPRLPAPIVLLDNAPIAFNSASMSDSFMTSPNSPKIASSLIFLAVDFN